MQFNFEPDDHGGLTMTTTGLTEEGKSELVMVNLPQMAGTPRAILTRLLARLSNKIGPPRPRKRLTLALGDYGRVRLEPARRDGRGDVLYVQDADLGAPDASRFVARLMALSAFKRMDAGETAAAVECFDVALALEPRSAMLYQARAWARYGVICNGGKGESQVGVLSIQVLGDLLQSIYMDPDRAEPYRDLLSMLRVFQPLDGGDWEDHRMWVQEIVRLALFKPTDKPEALTAREALSQFAQTQVAGSNK